MDKDKIREERERSYEYGLPSYLQHDLDAYKKGLEEKSSLLDCLWGELYGSINMAAISDNQEMNLNSEQPLSSVRSAGSLLQITAK